MKMSTRVILAALVASGIAWGTAVADHNEPSKATKSKLELVTAYAPCTAPNGIGDPPLSLPLCTPVVRSDAGCGFGPKGKGKVDIKSGKGDIKIRVNAIGLDAGCEGETLTFVSSVRVTTDGGGGSATVIDLPDVPTGSCVVSGGRCSIKTSVEAELGDVLDEGNNAGFELLGCGLTRGGARTASCGVLVK